VQFLSHEISNGVVLYQVRVSGPNDITFHLKDRYKRMRNFYQQLRRQLPPQKAQNLPEFPPKRLIGNKKAAFINQRKNGLQNFMNSILADPEIAKLKLTINYFKDHLQDKSEQGQLTELVNSFEGKKTSKSAPIIEEEKRGPA